MATLSGLRFHLCISLTLSGYLLFAFWFSLLPYYDRLPLSDVRTFSPTLTAGLAYALLISLLFACYGLSSRFLRRHPSRLSLWATLAIATFFSLPLLFAYPVNANDIYRYIIRGRVWSVYGESPFLLPPLAFPQDSLLAFAGEWAGSTSPYGPLWELLAGALTALSGDSLLVGLLLFKMVGLVSVLVVGALLAALASRDRASLVALLWSWNPAVLLMFVVDGHNDILMLLWLVLGYYFSRRGRAYLGFALIVLAPLTKPIALLALPIFFLWSLRRQAGWRARLRFAVWALASALVLSAVAFAPFGNPWVLGERLLREAAGGASFSAGALFILIVQYMTGAVPVVVVGTLLVIAFLMAALWLFWRTWCGRPARCSVAEIFYLYQLQALNFRIWYAVWSFPWLIADYTDSADTPSTVYRLHVGIWFLLTSQLSVVIYGHLRAFALGGSYLAAHLIGVPFTFVLPFALALLSVRHEN